MKKGPITAISEQKTSKGGKNYKSVFFAGDDNGGKGYGSFSYSLADLNQCAPGDEVEYETDQGFLKKIRKTGARASQPIQGPVAAAPSTPNQPAAIAASATKGWQPDPGKDIGIYTSYVLDVIKLKMEKGDSLDIEAAVDLVFSTKARVELALNGVTANSINDLFRELEMDPAAKEIVDLRRRYKSALQLKLDLEAVKAGKKDFSSDTNGVLAVVNK